MIIEARKTNDPDERGKLYKAFQEYIKEDIPAVFLYSPSYTYVQNNKVKGFNIKSIIIPSDRFNNLSDWYLKTKRQFIKN